MIGKRVRELRKARKITQEELSRLLNVHQTAISQWETQRTEPDVASIHKIAELFDVTTDYLMGVSDQPSVTISAEDAEVWELRESLRRNPDLHMLFSLTKDASKEDISKAVKIIQMLKGSVN